MKISRTHDMDIVKSIMMHPAIWPHIHEDGVDEATPIDHDGFYWMLLKDGDHEIGVYLAHAINQSCMEMHTCLLPEVWGEKASEAAKLLGDYLFFELGAKKVITKVPAYNRLALRYAKKNGMKIEGNNRESYLHRGELIDQIMLGITLKEWKWQQQSLSSPPLLEQS